MMISLRERLEQLNRRMLADNDRIGYGLWQDMTPYLDAMERYLRGGDYGTCGATTDRAGRTWRCVLTGDHRDHVGGSRGVPGVITWRAGS